MIGKVTGGLLLALVLVSGVHAQEDGDQESIGCPPGWQLPAPQTQLEMDPKLIPIGKGAIFVPAMTDPAGEPPDVVMAGDEVVARTSTGHKTILSPGLYPVLVGSGVETQMVLNDVEVFEGHSVLVQPIWAGMVVKVVDGRGMEFRGSYEMFALPSGEDFGLGLGADETLGETLRTWLLPPGRYMIVRSGETPMARTDFITVRVLAGEMIYFTLVQDEETGDFLGGGVIDRGEGKTEIENWRLGLTIGGDVQWNRQDKVAGSASGNSIGINVFLDFSMRYLDPNHLAYFRLQVDEGGNSAFPDPDLKIADLQKTVDEVDLDAIYTYRILTWLGPYVRFGLDTNILPGFKIYETQAQDVLIYNSGGVELQRLVLPSEVRLAGSFDPLELKEGVGVSFDISPHLMLDLHLRVGLGARQYLVRSLLKEQGYDETSFPDCQSSICFIEVDPNDLLGMEATFIGSTRISRWLMIDTELDTLVPFISSETFANPVINWKNTISLRLVSFASLAYVIKLDYDRQLSQFLQAEQRILLRFTFDIL